MQHHQITTLLLIGFYLAGNMAVMGFSAKPLGHPYPIVEYIQRSKATKKKRMKEAKIGSWGGRGISLSDEGGRGVKLEFDCAEGSIEKFPAPDIKGKFSVIGKYTQNRPGPIRMDRPVSTVKVRYFGRIIGNTMTLEIEYLDSLEKLGPYKLIAKGHPRIVRCL